MLGCRQRSSHGRPGLGFQQPPQPVCSVSSVGCRTLAMKKGVVTLLTVCLGGATERAVMIGPA